jgi:glutathione peroxidase
MFHKIIIPAIAFVSSAFATDLTTIAFADAAGARTTLKDYEGKVVMIVNVASKCGLTRQYEALEALYRKHKDDGFVILAFPCNDFANQEPGTIEEIQAFCQSKFDVTFPLMGKLSVKGKDQHALYAALTGPEGAFPGDVKWNFGKFLIGRDGKPIARFEPRTTPDDKELVAAVRKALAD